MLYVYVLPIMLQLLTLKDNKLVYENSYISRKIAGF